MVSGDVNTYFEWCVSVLSTWKWKSHTVMVTSCLVVKVWRKVKMGGKTKYKKNKVDIVQAGRLYGPQVSMPLVMNQELVRTQCVKFCIIDALSFNIRFGQICNVSASHTFYILMDVLLTI